MNTALTPLRKEKGVVLVLVALCLVALMGVAALAIDLSHASSMAINNAEQLFYSLMYWHFYSVSRPNR